MGDFIEIYRVSKRQGPHESTAPEEYHRHYTTLEGAKADGLSHLQYHFKGVELKEWVMFDNGTWKANITRDYVWYRIDKIAVWL
jgi:hypothetical protein